MVTLVKRELITRVRGTSVTISTGFNSQVLWYEIMTCQVARTYLTTHTFKLPARVIPLSRIVLFLNHSHMSSYSNVLN